MSVQTAVARVAEIQALMNAAGAGPVIGSPASASGFDAQLAAASGAAGAGAQGAEGTGGVAPLNGGGPSRFDDEIAAAARKYRLDPAVLKGLIRQESNFNPNAVSPAGAKGLTQLMPGTAAGLGVKNPFDPVQAINGGAKYLRQMLDMFDGNIRKALAAYNAGPGAVKRHGGIPPYAETRNYVNKVLGYAEGYRRQGVAA
jgi:soluble lytic murein transglycosylase-like protein